MEKISFQSEQNMLLSFRKLLSGWIAFCYISSAMGAKVMFAKPAQCSDRTEEECSVCVVPSNDPHHVIGQELMDHIQYGNISFHDTHTNYLSWNYDENIVSDAYNITVSFTSWNGKVGRALNGCCGIPLSERGCHVEDCANGHTYLAIGYQHFSVATYFEMDAMISCEHRLSARYFTICVHELTAWRERYNCECAVYDSATGKLKPGNHTTEFGKNETEIGEWYFDKNEPRQYQVCVFTMNKDDVMARGSLADDDDVMDSVAFDRGVFYMKDFSGFNGSIIDDLNGRNVNCTLRTFKGAEMFNISSINLSKHLHSYSNNETFTCLAPFPHGSEKFVSAGTHVKCMPQNATFSMSHVYEKKMKMNSSFVSAMTVFIPLLGAIALMAVVCVLGMALRKKFNKFMKEMKVVPDELNTVMQESYLDFASKLHFNCDEKEQCQAFDREEKDRILSLRQKEEERQLEAYERSRLLKIDHNGYDPFRPHIGSRPSFLDVKSFHSNLQAGPVVIDPSFVVCCQGAKTYSPDSVLSDGGERDSGCQFSVRGRQSYASEDELSSPEVPYMLRHVPDEIIDCDKCDPIKLDVENLKRMSLVLCDLPGDGYWTKRSFRKKGAPDSVSRCSNDTGCGTDSGNEEESSLSSMEYELNSKKHPFIKSTSKDSGVTTGSVCSNSLRDSISDISDDLREEEEYDYSPKTFEINFAERVIVSCITTH